MRIKIQAHPLKSALARLTVIAEKKTSRPFLSNIHIQAKFNQTELSATDMEVASKIVIPSNVEKEGSFCVNARNIFEIVKELPDELVEIELIEKENILKIRCETIDFSLIGLSDNEYPQLFFNFDKKMFSINSSSILDGINKTSHAISSDDTRLYLNGLFFQQINNKLRIVASDAYRLSLMDHDFQEDSVEFLENGIIIPRKGINELKKLAETYPNEMIDISVNESFLFANISNLNFLSIRLIAREYPRYQAVIPNRVECGIIFERNALLNAVKRAKIMSDEKTHGIRIRINNNEMQITANNIDRGKVAEKIAVDYNGKELELSLNAKFLIDILIILDGDDAILELNNEFGPILVKSYSTPNFLGLIMPLKI